jgi:GTP-binding protein
VDTAAEGHRRRVSTAVINEVLQEAITWHSPPTNRQGKQGKIYYGTQVSSQPPTIALFVNDPQRFNDNYRRYIDRQFREQLGFKGTPIRIVWRGKKVRDVERNTANRATRV